MSIKNAPNDEPQYCWDHSWITPYESLWSLIHKFALLNWVSIRQSVIVFTETQQNTDLQARHMGLVVGTKLNQKKLAYALCLSTEELNQSLIESILPVSELAWAATGNTLRYCPRCIEQGYHSIFHQVRWITKCPTHGILLRDECPTCGKAVNIDIPGRLAVTPYACNSCGFQFWQPYLNEPTERNVIQLSKEHRAILDDLYRWFSKVTDFAIISTDFERWLKMSRRIHDIPHRTKSIVELRGAEIPHNWGDFIHQSPPATISFRQRGDTAHAVVRFWGNNPTEAELAHMRTVDYRLKIGLRPVEITKETVSFSPEQSELKATYKSIRRHILKVFFRKRHAHCLSLAMKDWYWSNRRPTCTMAFAFLYWRNHWDRRHKIAEVWWQQPIERISGISIRQINRWLCLRIFAFQCYWKFWECVLLAKSRRMRIGETTAWEDNLITGRMSPYWMIDTTHAEHPVIHWWPHYLAHSWAQMQENRKY